MSATLCASSRHFFLAQKKAQKITDYRDTAPLQRQRLVLWRKHEFSNGLHLNELIDRLDMYNLDMYQLCDEATHLNCAGKPTIASLLDLGFTKVLHLFKSRATVSPPVSISDHLPVIFHTCLPLQPYTLTNHHHLSLKEGYFPTKIKNEINDEFLLIWQLVLGV